MALLACLAFLRNRFFGTDLIADAESFRRMEDREHALAAELTDLKQQVAGLIDQQAVTFLEAREPSESSGF